ncbi:hypothetical protein [Streptomyces sp. NPDC091371]|uniref:hypothetical protein n=1 Tax=Streptomyces sp. NPDC091371 TaxID=3155303 RepID=UPI00344093B9
MASHHVPNRRLRGLLEEAGWSGQQLANAVRKAGAESGHPLSCDRSTVARWLAGSRPRGQAAGALLEALSRRLGRPLGLADAGLSHSPADAPDPLPGSPWHMGAVRKLAQLTRAELDPARRALLDAALFSSTGLALPPDVVPVDGRAPAGGDGPPDDRQARTRIEALRSMAEVFASSLSSHGGGHARSALVAYLADDVTAWLSSARPGPHRCGLLAGAAQLAILAGHMCSDSGAEATAQHYYRIAVHLAAEANDALALTVAKRAMSTQAGQLRHFTASLRLAEAAVADARSRTAPFVQAYAHAQHAVAAAQTGDRHTALAALHTSERLMDQDADRGPFTGYPRAAFEYQSGQALAALGDIPGALALMSSSLQHRDPGERRARALSRSGIAELRLRQGHVEAAAADWAAFLDDVPALHSAKVAARVSAMRGMLRPHHRQRRVSQLFDQARLVAPL